MKVWRETAVGAAIVDKVYPVTPSSITVKTGMITGEVIELKVTERVDKGSGRVVSPARLTGKLRLENTSANRTASRSSPSERAPSRWRAGATNAR